MPVPVFAIGQGHEMFTGYYDITDIPQKIKTAMGLNN
jgi:alkaline phosphatase